MDSGMVETEVEADDGSHVVGTIRTRSTHRPRRPDEVADEVNAVVARRRDIGPAEVAQVRSAERIPGRPIGDG